MLIKNIEMSELRAWGCLDSIVALKNSLLRHPYIGYFVHDITYGKGRLNMLSNNSEWLTLYYTNPLPLFFTNESGRILPDGVYVTNTLPMAESEKKRYTDLKGVFKFTHMLLIVKHEGDVQHTYSLTLNCDENRILSISPGRTH
jgi:hypothetical protein